MEVTVKIYCPECNAEVDHNYTGDDILTLESIDLKCQNCGREYHQDTATLVEQIKAMIAERYTSK